MHAMGDVDDCHSGSLEFSEDSEERLRFSIGESRRRFIEDENSGTLIDCSRDLDDLASAERELSRGGPSVHRLAKEPECVCGSTIF